MNIRQILATLRSERNRLDQAISALAGLSGRKRGPGRPRKSGKPRHMSAAARKRIAAAMRKRWAERKRGKN